MPTQVVPQKYNDPLVPGNSPLTQSFLSDWRWVLAGTFFSFEFAGVLLFGWPSGLLPDVRLPYFFAKDGLLIQWLAQRAIEGWVFTNPRSGFPFAQIYLTTLILLCH